MFGSFLLQFQLNSVIKGAGEADPVFVEGETSFLYGIKIEAEFSYPYGDMPSVAGVNTFLYSDATPTSSEVSFSYSDVPYLQSLTSFAYSDMSELDVETVFEYALLESVEAEQISAWDILSSDPVESENVFTFSVRPDQQIQSVNNTPTIEWNGQTVKIFEANLSCDEDSPVWIASVSVSDLSDFAAISIGDAIQFDLMGEVFDLIVDGKTLSRENGSEQGQLTAISPIAMLGSPWSSKTSVFNDAPILAKDAVEYVIGPVTWQLYNWLIPANQFAIESATPLEIARRVVASLDGLIESAPDGSITCRPRYPVSPTLYPITSADQEFFDSDVFSSTSDISPQSGFNRIQVDNNSGEYEDSDTNDSLSYNEVTPLTGVVQGYPNPFRSVDLGHTGNVATTISAKGVVSRVESEMVEFVSGRASVQFAVKSIQTADWNEVDLGNVTFDGKELTSDVAGESLLAIEYVTEAYEWDVAGVDGSTVQFVLLPS